MREGIRRLGVPHSTRCLHHRCRRTTPNGTVLNLRRLNTPNNRFYPTHIKIDQDLISLDRYVGCTCQSTPSYTNLHSSPLRYELASFDADAPEAYVASFQPIWWPCAYLYGHSPPGASCRVVGLPGHLWGPTMAGTRRRAAHSHIGRPWFAYRELGEHTAALAAPDDAALPQHATIGCAHPPGPLSRAERQPADPNRTSQRGRRPGRLRSI